MEEIKTINITPLNGRVVIKPEKPKEKSKGGIILPESHEKLIEGIVIATTPSRSKYVHPIVSIGDRILFRNNIGEEVNLNDETFLIIEEWDIFAIINKWRNNYVKVN